ncbi:MAG: DUF362 domain-containing protein [Angelakisella sp.]
MNESKVYFTNMRTALGDSLQNKLVRLLKQAGMENIDYKERYVAIKIHFGEPGNLSYLRPNWAKTVADFVKQQGGKPFLTDCNTLYVGRRKNAIDHMDAAYENGFSPFSTGCQIMIADGLKGTDEVLVPVKNGELVKTAKIGRAVMDADIVISLTHFKGHESTGFGGAIKNIGMGCGSRAGKMEQHCGGKPEVDQSICRGCHACTKECAQQAIRFDENRKAFIDHNLCVGCGRCIGACNFDAIDNPTNSANDELDKKIAEYAQAVLDGRPSFHISIVNQVSPCCDCHGENDTAIIPDVGMFASFDPVALDVACADACNRQPVLPGSMLAESMQETSKHDHHDHFTNNYEVTNWRTCTEHAEKIGLGSQQYELITVK